MDAFKKVTFEENFSSKRQYPRRSLSVPVGVLVSGKYLLTEAGEIGEGGMAIKSDYVFEVGQEMVLSFQIPKGDFVFVRGVIRSAEKSGTLLVYGLLFQDIQFAAKRQIRAYVSSRNLNKAKL